MWILLVASSAGFLSAEPAPVVSRVEPAPLLSSEYDVRDTSPSPALAAPAAGKRTRPLTIPALDDDNQRLRVGIRPGGRVKLGFAYRLSFGE